MSIIRLLDNTTPAEPPPIDRKYMWVDANGLLSIMDHNGVITVAGLAAFDFVKLTRDSKAKTLLASDINTNAGVVDVSDVKTINITLDANITDLQLTGLDTLTDGGSLPVDADGLSVIINFIQDSTGGRSVTTGTSIIYPAIFGTLVLDGTPDSIDTSMLLFQKVINKYKFMSIERGFNI